MADVEKATKARFDPDNLPDEFTVEYLKGLTLGDLERLETDETPLTERQQETFQAARRELLKPVIEMARRFRKQHGDRIAKMSAELAESVSRPLVDRLKALEQHRPTKLPDLAVPEPIRLSKNTDLLQQMTRGQREDKERQEKMIDLLDELVRAEISTRTTIVANEKAAHPFQITQLALSTLALVATIVTLVFVVVSKLSFTWTVALSVIAVGALVAAVFHGDRRLINRGKR